MQITQASIYNRFNWARPVDLEIDDSVEGFFSDVNPWTFNQAQLNLIVLLLEEVESWFKFRGLPIDLVIIEYREMFGYVVIDKICANSEVDDIFEKYQAIKVQEYDYHG